MSPHTPDHGSPSYPNNHDIHDLTYAKRGCCFWIPFLRTEPNPPSSGGSSVFWQRIKPDESTANSPTTTTAAATAVKDDPWWVRGWKTIRAWSEIVAGPEWKTFIRRFNKRRHHHNKGQFWRPGYGKFQYDPMSYALNFDEGPGQNGHFDEDILGRGFSSRFSLPPSAKSSLDFDKECSEKMASFT